MRGPLYNRILASTALALILAIPSAVPAQDAGKREGALAAAAPSAPLPVAAPADVGWKARVAVAEVPAAMVLGVVIPVTLNSAPAREITETVRSAEPRLEIVTVELLIEPMATVPN